MKPILKLVLFCAFIFLISTITLFKKLDIKKQSRNVDLSKISVTSSKYPSTTTTRVQEEVKLNKELAVVVIACRRVESLEILLEAILKYRPSSDIPIFVSQDCDVPEIPQLISTKFQNDVKYIKHEKQGNTTGLKRKKSHQYVYLSNHYKNALQYFFDENQFETVIIIEDDLMIAPDFFSYFLATKKLLLNDPTLLCVSAWNDNSMPDLIDQNATSLLYRTDFFAGLGWMLTKSLWTEIGHRWPNAYWDDWLREPQQRRNRQCVRPEIGRTSMQKYGRYGASSGQFFDTHLKKIVHNEVPVDFEEQDLSYLEPKKYEELFREEVSKSRLIEKMRNIENCNNHTSFKIAYTDLKKFVKTNRLKIMSDEKRGIHRSSYNGIIPIFHNNCRVFIVPKNLV
ncbi:unnamed protein product [Caenorhabditis angaria]|uniref:Alpha-1,3-mannosyl-glycoprotein 2-beta-N-acetylglucosaminyltransferase n=1 Tax=Caenorhabditis angaria TaxID=860376 RepID=A0A9P1II44_9PELO|nr:unnamed protein product [Caenorhabditis angaria]